MLRELLRGFEARQPQTVANMSVIPLVGQESEYGAVGTMTDIYLARDLAYDRLHMSTSADYPTILPSGYTLITKEQAQDRTVPSKTILAAKKTAEVAAFCVQSSQPGHMSKENKDKQQVRMLPATVRKAAYLHRNTNHFSTLWQTLGKYNTSLGLRGDYLATFFDHFKAQLDQFIAEFELVPFQRGAIILINDGVMGVEISPNPLAWSAQWEPLIRDCYGSEAISRQREFKTIDETSIFGDVATLEELSEKLTHFEDQEFAYAERIIEEILNQAESQSERQTVDGLKVVDVETPDFVGQAVRHNGTIIDLTLLRRDAAERGFRFNRR
jgi:hypothetical protein